MSPVNGARPGNLLKENLILAMKGMTLESLVTVAQFCCEEIMKLIEILCHSHEKIFVTKLSPVNWASLAHVQCKQPLTIIFLQMKRNTSFYFCILAGSTSKQHQQQQTVIKRKLSRKSSAMHEIRPWSGDENGLPWVSPYYQCSKYQTYCMITRARACHKSPRHAINRTRETALTI